MITPELPDPYEQNVSSKPINGEKGLIGYGACLEEQKKKKINKALIGYFMEGRIFSSF